MVPKPDTSSQRTRQLDDALVADPQQAAQFIADMALDLRNIASRAKLGLLTQLLEMSFSEALSLSGQRSKKREATRRAG